MTVGNPENFNIKIKTGREEVDNRKPCDFTNLTLKKLLSWIDSQNVSNALKAELKKSASAFPHQALPAWQKNFNKHLSKAQARLRKAAASLASQKVAPDIEEIDSISINENNKKLDSVDSLFNEFDSEEVVEDSHEVVEDSHEVVEDSHEVVEDSHEVVEDSEIKRTNNEVL